MVVDCAQVIKSMGKPDQNRYNQTIAISIHNKERGGIICQVSSLPSSHWVLFVTQDTLCVNQMSHNTLFYGISGDG